MAIELREAVMRSKSQENELTEIVEEKEAEFECPTSKKNVSKASESCSIAEPWSLRVAALLSPGDRT